MPLRQEHAEQELTPITPLAAPLGSGTVPGGEGGTAVAQGDQAARGLCLFQCQDLMSQTSSPLSQNDSCTGRSADLLLPAGDTGKRQHDRGTEVAPYAKVERYKAQVSRCFCVSWGRSAQLSADLDSLQPAGSCDGARGAGKLSMHNFHRL